MDAQGAFRGLLNKTFSETKRAGGVVRMVGREEKAVMQMGKKKKNMAKCGKRAAELMRPFAGCGSELE